MRITVLGSGGWGTALALLLLDNGNDVETAVDSIFKALEKDQFYILDTPKYERLLCEQGVFEAEKVRPVDYYTLN